MNFLRWFSPSKSQTGPGKRAAKYLQSPHILDTSSFPSGRCCRMLLAKSRISFFPQAVWWKRKNSCMLRWFNLVFLCKNSGSTVASKSIHALWTIPRFVILQPQALMYFIGISCEKPTERKVIWWTGKESYTWFKPFCTNKKLKHFSVQKYSPRVNTFPSFAAVSFRVCLYSKWNLWKAELGREKRKIWFLRADSSGHHVWQAEAT